MRAPQPTFGCVWIKNRTTCAIINFHPNTLTPLRGDSNCGACAERCGRRRRRCVRTLIARHTRRTSARPYRAAPNPLIAHPKPNKWQLCYVPNANTHRTYTWPRSHLVRNAMRRDAVLRGALSSAPSISIFGSARTRPHTHRGMPCIPASAPCRSHVAAGRSVGGSVGRSLGRSVVRRQPAFRSPFRMRRVCAHV